MHGGRQCRGGDGIFVGFRSNHQIGRSALQKPWIFQEIKEKRVIDMRSSQRFDMLKEFVNYGLEHWGSDTVGVHKTRRFLCEWYV